MYATWTVSKRGVLEPADEAAVRICAKRVGEVIRADMTPMRSPDQLRLYWKLIDTALQNQSGYATKEDLSAAALCHIGHCHTVKNRDGTTVQRPKSIALGNMEPAEFNQIFDAVAKLLADTLGITVETLNAEVSA